MPNININTVVALILFLVTTFAIAAPVDSVDKRAPVINGWFRMCPVTDFGEPCQTIGWTSKKCSAYPSLAKTQQASKQCTNTRRRPRPRSPQR